jgi:hypothetical protein
MGLVVMLLEDIVIKFLVTGDRDWVNRKVIEKRLSWIPSDWVLVHGAARGADSIAAEFWKFACKQDGKDYVLPFPADWNKYGKRAGPIRNRQMLLANPEIEIVIAFHNEIGMSKGTKDMVTQAMKKGLPVEIITEGTYGTIYESP